VFPRQFYFGGIITRLKALGLAYSQYDPPTPAPHHPPLPVALLYTGRASKGHIYFGCIAFWTFETELPFLEGLGWEGWGGYIFH